MEDLVIIGSGCAGLTAAIYAARANLAPLVITGTLPGGLLTTTTVVENFPGFPEGVTGSELMERMQEQAKRFGARIKYAVVQRVDFTGSPFKVWTDVDEIHARAVIIATGASHRKLGLESEKLLEGRGVSYCATCDGALPVFRNQPLVVVGGGDSACEEALYLTRFASQIYLVHRRETLRASKIMAQRVLNNPKIQPLWNSVIVDILDVNLGRVTGVKVKNLVNNTEQMIEAAGVFVAIGHVPNTEIFRGQLAMDEAGYILRVEGSRTSVPGVFVAGDCTDKVYRQAITAAAMGCAAAIDAERYLGSLK